LIIGKVLVFGGGFAITGASNFALVPTVVGGFRLMLVVYMFFRSHLCGFCEF
jgi:hypothetical protein